MMAVHIGDAAEIILASAVDNNEKRIIVDFL